MDLCHCPMPSPRKIESGVSVCISCGLYYSEKEWKRDPRVKRAQAEILNRRTQTDSIVDAIMSAARK